MKKLKIVGVLVFLIFFLVTVDRFTIYSSTASTVDIISKTDQIVFPHDSVVDVYIDIDEETYSSMINNARDKEVVMADVTYNGIELKNIGIRTKGNSSLDNVAREGGDRFSFKIDLDYYVQEQNMYGISKINLNNLFADPTMMAEYIGYEIMEELGGDAPRTTYTALHINGEYYGLYLSVEQVNETFLLDHFGEGDGELYKPDIGGGSDLKYETEEPEAYPALVPENKENSNNRDIINLMKVIQEKGELNEVLNVESFAKYLAMSSATVHLDAYQGGMFHNYYMYNREGVFEWIAWDLNMAFNGFPKGGTDEQAVKMFIDEPVIGSMSRYPLIEAFFEDERNITMYHGYLSELIDGYLQKENFENRVLDIYEMINEYVKIDENAFYSYQEFEKSLFSDEEGMSLLTFVEKRNQSVSYQLNGDEPGSNNGGGNDFRGGMKDSKRGEDMPVENKEGKIKENPPDRSKEDREKNIKAGMKPDQGGPQNGKIPALPQGVEIEDIPEEFRDVFQGERMPSREEMDEIMNSLPEEVREKMKSPYDNQREKGMNPIMKEEEEKSEEEKSRAERTDMIMLLSGLSAMVVGIIVLKKMR